MPFPTRASPRYRQPVNTCQHQKTCAVALAGFLVAHDDREHALQVESPSHSKTAAAEPTTAFDPPRAAFCKDKRLPRYGFPLGRLMRSKPTTVPLTVISSPRSVQTRHALSWHISPMDP